MELTNKFLKENTLSLPLLSKLIEEVLKQVELGFNPENGLVEIPTIDLASVGIAIADFEKYVKKLQFLLGDRAMHFVPLMSSDVVSLRLVGKDTIENLKKINNQIRQYLDVATQDIYVFGLSADGKFYLKSDPLLIYPIKKDSARHRIIRALVEAGPGNFISTKILANKVDIPIKKFMTTIGQIKKQAGKRFRFLLKDELIEGKLGSGYRLGSKIRIKLDTTE